MSMEDNRQYTINEVKQLNLEVFGGCNIACPMCPQGSTEGREKEFKKSMKESLFKKIVEEAIPLGLQYVHLSGSGEPLLHRGFEDLVSYLTSKNLISMIHTNGQLLTPEKFESLCKAGLSIIKVSCMGWDRESYKHWMSVDTYERTREYLKQCYEILRQKKYKTVLRTHHLIQDINEKDYQLNMYLKNWVEYLDSQTEVWLAHSWGGSYTEENIDRYKHFKTRKLRTCGRPLSKAIEVRAGGLGKHQGAVVPCPLVLGNDSEGVMGHLDDQSLLEVVNGKEYREMRKKHIEEKFSEVDICKNCDALIEVPECLVWTNIKSRTYGGSGISEINYVYDEVTKSVTL